MIYLVSIVLFLSVLLNIKYKRIVNSLNSLYNGYLERNSELFQENKELRAGHTNLVELVQIMDKKLDKAAAYMDLARMKYADQISYYEESLLAYSELMDDNEVLNNYAECWEQGTIFREK